MKKILKGMMLLSVGLLLTGCGKNSDEPDSPQIQQPSENQNQIFDISTDKVALYEESVKSIVRVNAGSQLGSGVVYKKESGLAYILTNAHVLTDTTGNKHYENIEVIFHDFSRAKGTYIGLDKTKDVAVFTVKDTDSCVAAKIVAKDTDVTIGESVYAIGNPFGEYFSVTDGIISANRWKTSTSYISGSETLVNVYNSTATINSGNSGGALFNSKGEVIAINSMHPQNTNMRNFNYSIPINYFIKIANHIVKNNTTYVNAKLNIEGKSICDFSVDTLTSKGIKVKNGVYIDKSSETGLLVGRVITKINGNSVETLSDYEFELLKYSTGETITVVTVDNAGTNERTVSVTLK